MRTTTGERRRGARGRRRALLGTASALTAVTAVTALATTAPGQPAGRATTASADGGVPVRELDRAARDLAEPGPNGGLRELARAADGAKVVGLGEATHSSREFFTTKQRVFAHLVKHRGFRTFALETSWSTGRLLNDYVLHGRGDPRAIMSREFQYNYRFWNTREYLDLVRWMRAYNEAHPDPADKLRFLGNDLGFTGSELYDAVVAHARKRDPALAARLERLYRGLRPAPGTGTRKFSEDWLGASKSVREDRAARAAEALELLKRHGGAGARGSAQAWAVQHARAIRQTAYAFSLDVQDEREFARQMRFRDRSMARNTVWWNENVGDTIVLSSHNSHITYVAEDPARFPEPVGSFLREMLGRDFVSVGTTFDSGSFNAREEDFGGPVRRFAVEPARPGTVESGLERVRHEDYVLDLRKAPPKARAWLEREHPLVHNIGLTFPVKTHRVSLAASYDVVLHFSRVHAARLLP
ncbi:erythromycin esterase family protein [Streptomyces sp. NRRL F-5053]|uniref:erythromycin esterase family protein n=1 Tax=Streptomyces sp. NRRL F-5053 TaxID=1463854 RepID=UPI00068BEB56|nr:erythromycin esterase family protein [Streptomyces sp. NRRL F-5053]